METKSGYLRAEKRVRAGCVDLANLDGPPTTGSFRIWNSPSGTIEGISGHQQNEGLADTIAGDDGISPDDAPEVVWDDSDEEVRTMAS
jgi:hypothetical protein